MQIRNLSGALIHAGEPLVSALLMLMNISWENGILPIQWRQASVKFLKKIKKLDKEQEGFRHFRSTTNALLTFVQSIFNGFNQKESTIAVFIDLEKAFDSIWREGLLKLEAPRSLYSSPGYNNNISQ